MSDNTAFYLAFSHMLGIGPMRFDAIMSVYGDVKLAYNAPYGELKTIIGDFYAREFVEFRAHFNPWDNLERITENKIDIITPENDIFPESLKNISDKPICLYVRGELKNWDLNSELLFSIVGTRKPSGYGYFLANHFASALVSSGFSIVSGMAIGIDRASHEAAMKAGGRTIAILGCGVDIVYPPSNADLYEEILRRDGLIISEFPPGMTVKRGLFIARNRLISGISQGTLMIEGLKDSGALITAREAVGQGKNVYIPPIPLNSQLSQGPNLLLRDGARIVTCPNDILDDFSMAITEKKANNVLQNLKGGEESIASLLHRESQTIDELILELQMTPSQIMEHISSLEMKNVIEKISNGKYQLK